MNKKKKKSLWAAYSNSTLYFALVLSLMLHTIVIYSIPAVNVFSEGPDPSSEPILVDFFQEDSSESLSDIFQPDVDQFLADIPEADNDPPLDSPSDMVETQVEPEQEELDMTIPRVEKLISAEYDTFVLSQSAEHEPDISLLAKRSLSQRPIQQQPAIAKQPPLGKVTMTPPSQPFQIQPPREVKEHEPVKMTTSSDKQFPQQDSREQGIQFPLRPTRDSSMLSQNTSENLFPTGKPQALELAKESPVIDFARRESTTFSQKRQFGIVKEKETDANQFGIFAGRKFEEPPAKDAVEEAISSVQQAPPRSEETEVAQRLSSESQIEGPVRGRAIIRRPQPPQVNVGIEVELHLKFWVLPDGTIGEVIPIKRGDAQLEHIAITYLKQWRFEPLSPGVPQEKIWGTIPIRFTVQ